MAPPDLLGAFCPPFTLGLVQFIKKQEGKIGLELLAVQFVNGLG